MVSGAFKIFNSLTQCLEPLRLRHPSKLSWYACGPTVYEDSHIGHARAYICHDVIRRILAYYQPSVEINFKMGITDIDDKILKKANQLGTNFRNVSRRFEEKFVATLDKLNINYPSQFLRVTDNIESIKCIVQTLLDHGNAYQTQTGSIYFSIENYQRQGFQYPKFVALGCCPVEGKLENTEKLNPRDFALWKSCGLNEDGWHAFGVKGRPGWHIECSANVAVGFPNGKIDLHSGGIDLRFPHHENEIAQSQAFLSAQDWCTSFLHIGHVYLGKDKMSKSLGNVVPIDKFLDDHGPAILRMVCLRKPYGENFEYTDSIVNQSKALLNRIHAYGKNSRQNLNYSSMANPLSPNDLLFAEVYREIIEVFYIIFRLKSLKENVRNAALDNFSFASILHMLERHIETGGKYRETAGSIAHPLLLRLSVETVEDIFYRLLGFPKDGTASDELLQLAPLIVSHRQQLRAWALKDPKTRGEALKLCDDLRKDLVANGIAVHDTRDSSSWLYI